MKHNSLENRAYQSALLAGKEDDATIQAIERTEHRITYSTSPTVTKRQEYIPPVFSNDWVRWVHRNVVKKQRGLAATEVGYYRSRTKQNIATFKGKKVKIFPDYSKVQALMDEWCKNAPTMSPKEAFVAFERIHPFTDANGRVGRHIYWTRQKQLGEAPMLFSYDDREEYDKWFEESEVTNG